MLRSEFEVTRQKAFMSPCARHAPMRMNRLVRGIATASVLLALSVFGPVVATEPAWANGDFHLAGGQKAFKLHLPVGHSQVINVDVPFATAVIGDPATVDMAPLTDTSLYVLGQRIGTTNLTLFDTDERLMAVIDIEVTHDLAGLREAIGSALPSVKVRVRSANGRIMLDGAVPDAVALDRVLTIAREFAREAGNAEEGRVINALTVAATQQVMLEVRFLEAQRSSGRDLGINWNANVDGFQFATLGGLGSQGPITNAFLTGLASTGAMPFGALVADLLSGGNHVDIVIKALEERGLARRLAEPNLTALSGQPANFLAGGEFPVPVAAEEGRVTIEFKRFGVGLAFTPTVLADGVINLIIEPEVSELDFTRSIEAAGFNIPSLVVRRATTTVELRDGQSLAMAGLLQTVHSRNHDQIPWLGEVQVIGALFRSAGFQKQETDLVVIVTPRLIVPGTPGTPFKSPLDNLKPGNDIDFFVMGKQEVSRGYIQHVETGGAVAGPFGHIIDLPQVHYYVEK